jgi:hypothetical protein
MDLGSFRRDYRELLDDVAAERANIDARAIAAHWPHVGRSHRGLLLVGQALHGWAIDWNPDMLDTPTGRERILDEASGVHADLDEPMSWVPTNRRVRRSSFWVFAKRLADAANPGPEPWFSRLAWWNLYPLAPTDPEGNPQGLLKSAQQHRAGALVEDVAAAIGSDRIVLVAGRMRHKPAEAEGLQEMSQESWPIFARGSASGRRWVVGEHPGWASRQGFGAIKYAAVVGEMLGPAQDVGVTT